MAVTNLSRIFLSQESLEAWLTDGRATIDDDILTDLQTARRFTLREGVRFLAEVSGTTDEHKLVGRVKDLEQLTALGGEHMADSVLLGETAYQVQPGFVGALITNTVAPLETVPSVHPAEAASVPPEAGKNQRKTIVALQQFFLNNVK